MDLKLKKEISSSQEICYKAFTEPEILSQWFTTNAKADLKIGGRYENDDKDEGEFLELSPYERIKFTWDNKEHCPGTEVMVEFIMLNEGHSEISLTHSKLESESHIKDMETGWRWALTCLKSFLETGIKISFADWEKQNI